MSQTDYREKASKTSWDPLITSPRNRGIRSPSPIHIKQIITTSTLSSLPWLVRRPIRLPNTTAINTIEYDQDCMDSPTTLLTHALQFNEDKRTYPIVTANQVSTISNGLTLYCKELLLLLLFCEPHASRKRAKKFHIRRQRALKSKTMRTMGWMRGIGWWSLWLYRLESAVISAASMARDTIAYQTESVSNFSLNIIWWGIWMWEENILGSKILAFRTYWYEYRIPGHMAASANEDGDYDRGKTDQDSDGSQSELCPQQASRPRRRIASHYNYN